MSSPLPPSFSHPGPAPPRPELPDGVEPSPAPGAPRRGLAAVPVWSPFLAMLVTFFVASIASIILVAVVEAAGTRVDPDDLPPGILIGGSVVQDVALLVFAVVFARIWSGPLRPSDFGLRRTPLKPALAWAAGIYVAFWVFAAVYSAIVGTGPEQDLVSDLKDEDSLVVLIGFAVLVAFIAPIVEEFFFRGFLFGVLRERLGVLAAILIAGTIFGLIHAAGTPIRTLGILVALGVGLCVLYWKTNSLLPGIALHSLHNAISFGATKELVWWFFIALLLGSVALVLLTANAVIARERRPA